MSKANSSPRRGVMSTAAEQAPVRTRGEGREAVTDAAREIFAERGYYGTSIREIAKRAGLSLSALYYWYPGKDELLAALLEDSDRDYHGRCEAALDDAGGDPVDRLCALVRATVEFRVERQVDSRITTREARHLKPEHSAFLVNQGHVATSRWATVINEGVSRGVFRCAHPEDARRTIIAACNAIAQWYDPAGTLTAADLVDRYIEIALRVVDVDGAARP